VETPRQTPREPIAVDGLSTIGQAPTPAPDAAEGPAWLRNRPAWLLAAATSLVVIIGIIIGVIAFKVLSSPDLTVPRSESPLSNTVLLWAGKDQQDQSDIWQLDTEDESLSILVDGSPSAILPAISPDRKTIAYVQLDGGNGTAHLVAADGSSDRELFQPNESCPSVGRMSWSPDGTMLAIACFGHDGSRQGLRVVDVDGHEVARLQTDDYAGGPTWSSLGIVAYWDNPDLPESARAVGGRLFSISVRLSQDQSIISSQPHQLTNGTTDAQPAWSPDGTNLAYQRLSSTSGLDIWLLNMDTGTSEQLTSGAGNEFDPSWSPDGLHIVYAKTNNASEDSNLWIMDVNGDNNQLLGARTGNDANASWYR
jgi:TolB protein